MLKFYPPSRIPFEIPIRSASAFADGTMQEVLPQRAIPINLGLKLNLAGTLAEMVA